MNRNKSILLSATALAMFAAPQVALAQTAPGAAVVFLPAPTGATSPDTDSRAISADGRTIAGAPGLNGLYIWTNGVPVEVPVPASGGFRASAISGDGQTITGENTSSGTRVALIYRNNIGFSALPDPSANEVAIFSPSVNSDGSIFAVTSNVNDGRFPGCTRSYICGVINRAYRWSVAGGYQSLGTFGATWSLSTSGISGDGNVISGNAYDTAASSSILIDTAFRWTPSDGLQALPSLTPATGSPSFAASNGISRDGSTIVGVSRGADNLVQAVFWRGLSVTALGYVPGTNPASAETEARAANADGSIIVGTNRLDRAWRWSAASGMQDLNLIATNAGLNLNGFVLTDAVGVSDNGQFITGNSFNSAQGQFLGYVLQLAQVTQSRLIVTLRLPGVTQTSIVNQTFNTQVDALLNGTNVFTRTVTDPINGAGGVTALADALSALQVDGGLRRVVIGAPTLLSNVTTVLGTTNNTVDVASGTTTSTATINTFGPANVITGDLGVCATGVVGSSAPTGCSLPGTPVTVDSGILNSNVYTQTNNTVTPTTTQTVNQLITAKWQVSATAGNQFGTVHALVGPAAFERGDRLIGQLLGMGGGDGAASSGLARAAMPMNDESGLGGGEGGLTMFGGYFGGRSSIDADASIPVARVKGDSDGFVLGLQQALGDAAHVGIAVDHGSSEYIVRDPLYPETLKLKHTQAALFAGWSDGGFSLSGAASYGFGTARTSLLTPTTPATGSRDINSWSLGAQAGYAVPLGKDASLTPHVGIRHTSAKLKRFTEVGGPTPLLGLSQTVDRTRFYAGLEAEAGIDLGGLTLTPRVYGRIARDSGDASGTADLVFASAPTGPVMQALGPGVGKTVGELGGGLDANVSDSISIWASYDGTFREHANSNSAKVGLTVRW